MRFLFKICDKTLVINNYVTELNERIEEMIMTFPKSKDKTVFASLSILSNHIKLKYDKKHVVINIKPCNRDIYQIFYFFIYNCFLTEKQSFIHSTVVSKNNNAYLILGTFGAGKTTLSLTLQKMGYEINSADHSLIEIKNNNIYLKYGTMRMKYNGKNSYLPYQNISKEIKIKKIIYLIGLCEKGIYTETYLNDSIRKAKKIYSSVTWVYTNPLVNYTNQLLNYISPTHIEFIENLSNSFCPMSVVRGDAKQVAKKLDDFDKKNVKFNLSAINDEIADDIDLQIKTLKDANFEYIELRKINNKDLGEIDAKLLKEVASKIRAKNLKVSCIDSPIGKFNNYYKETELKKYLKIAKLFECRYIRVFSNVDKLFERCRDVLKHMQTVANKSGVKLLLENEKNHYYCSNNFKTDNFNLLFDNDNFFQDKKSIFKNLKNKFKNIRYIHLRDYSKKRNKFTCFGKGDEKLKKILKYLIKHNFDGFISFETHLPMNDNTLSKQKLFLDAVQSFNQIIKELL